MAGNRSWLAALVGVVVAATALACSDGSGGEVACSNDGASMYAVDHDVSARQPTAEAALDYFLASPAIDDMPTERYEQVDYLPYLDGSTVPLPPTSLGQRPEQELIQVPFVHRTGARIDTTLVAHGYDGTWAITTVVRCG